MTDPLPLKLDWFKIDWPLLHQQKLTLLEVRGLFAADSSHHDALSGIIHLLDALQDAAVDQGLWKFPDDSAEKK